MNCFMPIFGNSEVGMAFPNVEILDSILDRFARGQAKRKAGIRASDVSPYFWIFRIYWMSMWPMVTSTFLTGNCMMISIGIATWLELLVCKSWASRHPAGELYNSDLVNAESSHWCVYIRQMFAFLKKPLVDLTQVTPMTVSVSILLFHDFWLLSRCWSKTWYLNVCYPIQTEDLDIAMHIYHYILYICIYI